MERTELVDFLDRELEKDLIEDSTYNGLQIEGSSQITKIGFAVDSCLPVFEQAVTDQCDMLIVHHGLIWGGWKNIKGADRQKLSLLLEYNINLYVSHLPLDRHPKWGNNVQLIKKLDATILNPILEVGYTADFCEPLAWEKLQERLRNVCGLISSLSFGPEKVDRIAVSTGSFRPNWLLALREQGIQTVVTGEGSSPSLLYYPAQELGMNIAFCGHYNSEVFGVQALQEMISKRFPGINTIFIDKPTGW